MHGVRRSLPQAVVASPPPVARTPNDVLTLGRFIADTEALAIGALPGNKRKERSKPFDVYVDTLHNNKRYLRILVLPEPDYWYIPRTSPIFLMPRQADV